MVLSNKKLKQKIRTELAESLIDVQGSGKSKVNLRVQSLKEVLNSATQKPRLTKREKRREKQEVQDGDGKNGAQGEENEGSNGMDLNKKKKRKRKDDLNGENDIESSEKKQEIKKKSKKKKNKQKRKKNNNKVESKQMGNEERRTEEVKKYSESKENLKVGTKVYVGGIPYYSTEDDIRSFFESCGTITEVDCMRFSESGKFRGIAIINFKTEAAAKRALALDGVDMGGLFLKIQAYKSNRVQKSSDFAPEIIKGYNRIYLGNLSWDITEDDVRSLFTDCKISSIRFGEDKITGEFLGYAHVDFNDSTSLQLALKQDQKVVCDRPARVSCAVPKKNFKTDMDSSLESPDKKNKENSTKSGGSKKRRTCYECGVPGHLSSSCPRKKASEKNHT